MNKFCGPVFHSHLESLDQASCSLEDAGTQFTKAAVDSTCEEHHVLCPQVTRPGEKHPPLGSLGRTD